MNVFVTKRDGRREPLYVSKIKRVVAWGSNGLNLNPLVLESKFDEFLKEGISTDDIHQNIIYHARILTTPQEPEWSIVAGRLETIRRWKITRAYEQPFEVYLEKQLSKGVYNHPSLAIWGNRELSELGQYIDQDRDLNHSYGSVLTAQSKYLKADECIQQMHMVNAIIIASNESPSRRVEFAKRVYDALSKRKISLATPWLSNLRVGKSIASCFVLQMDDSIDSIFDNIKNIAMISKNGGGVGIDVSRIRAKGSPVMGNINASKGVTGWIKIVNDTMVAVDQGGTRSGAATIHLPVWHKDIADFIEMQTENGDLRKKSFDIFPQVGFHDLFMERVYQEATWYTFCPYEVATKLDKKITDTYGAEFNQIYELCVSAYHAGILTNVTQYRAKELLKQIMRVQFETGMPYIVFLDTLNQANPNKHMGTIPCFNLCTESTSVVEADKLVHVCNLASIVVGRIDSDSEMVEMAGLAARILDNGITLSQPPLSEGVIHNNGFRTIGIGIQGLHDYLARWDIAWSNTHRIGYLAEMIQYGAVRESIQMAMERGAYPFFKGSEWANGNMIKRFAEKGQMNWAVLQRDIDLYGIRNSQLTSPAPTSSTSLFQDSTAGVLPSYAGFYTEDNKSGKFAVYGMYLTDNPLAYEQTQPRFAQHKLVPVVAALQQFVDTGVSAEFVFDLNKPNASAKDLYDLILAAWDQGMKSIYYIRTIKKGQTIDNIVGGEVSCVACTG